MAPQVVQRSEYGYKADIWSIGVILFELLNGLTPFHAQNRKEFEGKVDASAFILTCLIWLTGCALCLLEFYRTQLRPLGFGHMQHYAYVYSSAGSTFCLLEYLFHEKVPPGLPAHILFHMGCLIGSIWGCE